MIDLRAASDTALVVAVARFRDQALAEVHRRHGGAVHALARRVLGCDQAAQDVSQEVFLRLWESPERFDPNRGTLRSFLLAVTHSRAVDSLRASASSQDREQRSAALVADDVYDIERHAWDLHVSDQVKRAVGGLPDTERRPIELAYFAGHTYREVASMLGTPEGTIKGRIRSGLSRLRQGLEQDGVRL